MTGRSKAGRLPIVAIVYGAGEKVDPLLAKLAACLAGRGVRLAGLVQHGLDAPGHSRCTMEAEVLPDGQRLLLSQDRGPGARGCRLDHALLLEALMLAERSLADADLLLLNRFGKVEAEGGGGRDLIAAAVGLDIPVLLAVPWRNIAPFRSFAGELAEEVRLEDVADLAERYCSRTLLHRASVAIRVGGF